MFLWRNHKWRGVNSKGYQYCETCNKARFVGLPSCQHKWKKVDHISQERMGRIVKLIDILECEHCGDRKKFIGAEI